MALESVVFQQELLGFTMKDVLSMASAESSCHDQLDVDKVQEEKIVDAFKKTERARKVVDEMGGSWDSCCSSLGQDLDEWGLNSSTLLTGVCQQKKAAAAGRRKRRRTKRLKNEAELEKQRMAHITVERNRRKQMNQHLAVLRSLLPASYTQRSLLSETYSSSLCMERNLIVMQQIRKGDQASIVGGAINFIRELEQLAHSLEAQKRCKKRSHAAAAAPFADLFTFPHNCTEAVTGNRPTGADVEVVVTESQASVKIFSRCRRRQLLKLVSGMQDLRLTVLHLNVSTVDEMVLYCFDVKVEDECRFTSVDDIATAVHQIVADIEDKQC